MILDSFFAIAATIEAAALIFLCAAFANELRRAHKIIDGRGVVMEELEAEVLSLNIALDKAKAQIAKFDHDGDGRVGGSKRS